MSYSKPKFKEKYGNFINGKFVAPVGGQYYISFSLSSLFCIAQGRALKDRMKKTMICLLKNGPAAVRKWVLLVKEPDGGRETKKNFLCQRGNRARSLKRCTTPFLYVPSSSPNVKTAGFLTKLKRGHWPLSKTIENHNGFTYAHTGTGNKSHLIF